MHLHRIVQYEKIWTFLDPIRENIGRSRGTNKGRSLDEFIRWRINLFIFIYIYIYIQFIFLVHLQRGLMLFINSWMVWISQPIHNINISRILTEWSAADNHYMDGMNFTTYDREQDVNERYNCALSHHGAWWYRSCLVANPNGLYLTPGTSGNVSCMTYVAFRGGGYESLRTMKLMFR